MTSLVYIVCDVVQSIIGILRRICLMALSGSVVFYRGLKGNRYKLPIYTFLEKSAIQDFFLTHSFLRKQFLKYFALSGCTDS